MTHICVSNWTIIGSDNGLSPGRRQAIIWTNAGILLIGPPGTNFSEILIEIHTFSIKKMHLKMSSAKGRLFLLCLNVLTHEGLRSLLTLCGYFYMKWIRKKMKENCCILIQISLKFVTKDILDNTQALVQVMAWHRTDVKPFPDS